LYKVAVKEVDGKTKVITQTGLPSTRQTADLTSYSKEIGADAVMIIPPYYIIPTEEGIYKHYEAIAKEVNIPIVIFNFPHSGHPNLRPEFVDRLTNIKDIVGNKEAVTDITHMQDIIRLVGNKISVMSGVGSNTLPALAAGAKGVMSGYITVVPKLAKELFDAFKGGGFMKAREINLKLYPLMRLTANAPGIKAALNMMGLPAGPVRPPLVPLANEEKEKMRNMLKKLDLYS